MCHTSSLPFTPLPGALAESRAIQEICRKKDWTIQMHTGPDASEKQFKSLYAAPIPGILHIASHAFSFGIDSENTETSDPGTLGTMILGSDNPLLRSGILLNGAARSWLGRKDPQEEEDGILTALELSALNFSQTDLIVLSACNTGLGEYRNIEGIFGLQRALKQAGARQIMMSLWLVPDQQTTDLMVYFYEALTDGQNAEAALTYARRKMQEQGMNAAYWAGFVLLN